MWFNVTILSRPSFEMDHTKNNCRRPLIVLTSEKSHKMAFSICRWLFAGATFPKHFCPPPKWSPQWLMVQNDYQKIYNKSKLASLTIRIAFTYESNIQSGSKVKGLKFSILSILI